jgi:hypothetical protein
MVAAVKTTAFDAGPGQVIFAFENPPEDVLLRLHSLLDQFDTWRAANPRRIVVNIEIVRDPDALVRSLNIEWFSNAFVDFS